MTAWAAFRDGIRRVNEAPLLVAGMAAVTLLTALPLTWAVEELLTAHLGASAYGSTLLGGASYDWWDEFLAQASSLGSTFNPSVIGFGAVLTNLSAVLDDNPVPTAIAGITMAWLVLWSFLTGGVLDRYARRRPTRASGFFGACGVHFWRFLRLGVLAALAYAVLFGAVHGGIFGAAYAGLTRDITSERSAFALRAAGYVVFSALLAATSLLLDFARVRIVVEDRRSAVGSLVASARFLARHTGRVCGLFALNAAALLMLMAAYAALSPGAPRSDIHMWLVLAVGQAYILGRHYLKLLVYASETALFQGALAHAAYTAAPALVWPEAPAVESITNAEPTAG